MRFEILLILAGIAIFFYMRKQKRQGAAPVVSASTAGGQSTAQPAKVVTRTDRSRKRWVFWGIVLLVLIGIGVEWQKYDFRHFIFCPTSLGYNLRIGDRQCLEVRGVDGDGVNNLVINAIPVFGSRNNNTAVVRLERVGGSCSGTIAQVDPDVGGRWLHRLVPTPCENLSDFWAWAIAKEAPYPEWIGNRIRITLKAEE